MNDVEKQQFERGKAAGAISVPVVAGATTGLSFTPEIVSAVADMAKAHPVAAKFIKRVIVAGGGAEALKHKDWLMKVLP
jgi:hydroxymethylpyrimidine/phosphomethylpyrimidine kinase